MMEANTSLENEIKALKVELLAEKQSHAATEDKLERSTRSLKAQLSDKDIGQLDAEDLDQLTKAISIKLEHIKEVKDSLENELKAAKSCAAAVDKLETSTRSLKAQLSDKDAARLEALLRVEQLQKDLIFQSAEAHKLQRKVSNMEKALQKETEKATESMTVQQVWKKEKEFLLQTITGLKQTMQDKEQQWELMESSMRLRVEKLESQVTKKKKKWW
ncbi:tropomyosin-like [Chaetodon trifascialis]|uniref:tropomyosin-like n=1 Tax=Chaetodon trifascialis TaxID=109706 RepID=UPI0039960E80